MQIIENLRIWLHARYSSCSDRPMLLAIHFLVVGKFYSIFSLLFGIGFGIQRHPSAQRFPGFFRRRMVILLAIGFIHLSVFWFGDILTL